VSVESAAAAALSSITSANQQLVEYFNASQFINRLEIRSIERGGRHRTGGKQSIVMLANQIDGAFQTIDFVFYPVVYDCFLRGRQEQQKQQSGFFCFPLVDFISRSSPR
jgi:hypothetical protein